MPAVRSPIRRAWLVLALVLALGPSAGCSVFEVIDGIGKDPKAEAAAKKKQAEADAALPSVPEGSQQEKLRAYYNRKPRQVVEDPNDPIVRCTLRSGVQFMRKNDCTLRGGRTGEAS